MKKTEDAPTKRDDDNNHDDVSPGETETEDDVATQEEKPKPANKGKLLIDAICVQADIAFPADLRLLNDAQEEL